MWVQCLPNWWKFWCDAYDHQVSRGVPSNVAATRAGRMLAHATRKQLEGMRK